jgi:hypothetical protein
VTDVLNAGGMISGASATGGIFALCGPITPSLTRGTGTDEQIEATPE